MARTFEEIENSIISAKEADANLDGLTSISKVSIWRSWVKLIATAILYLESLWDQKLKELDERAASIQAGTEKWYADRVTEWQYGYSLIESNGKLIYLIDDQAARLVSKVACVTEQGILKIKVAKLQSGELVKLTTAEKTSLNSYIIAIKFAGTAHQLISIDPDMVKIAATVYYDAKLDLTAFKTAFEQSINDYLLNIYFNGLLNINKLRDSGELVPGCIDFQITTLQCKPQSGAYAAVTRNYNPASGYFKIDPDFPLDTQIVYVAQ